MEISRTSHPFTLVKTNLSILQDVLTSSKLNMLNTLNNFNLFQLYIKSSRILRGFFYNIQCTIYFAVVTIRIMSFLFIVDLRQAN
jgi:hypothetical protein